MTPAQQVETVLGVVTVEASGAYWWHVYDQRGREIGDVELDKFMQGGLDGGPRLCTARCQLSSGVYRCCTDLPDLESAVRWLAERQGGQSDGE